MDARIVHLHRQYLQQLDELFYPTAMVLLEPSIQNEISYEFFDSLNGQHLPPLSYQRRVLKNITDRILSAIQDSNEDEISDKLMEHMAVKSTTKPMSAFKAAQQKSVVSYHLPSDFLSQHPVRVHIEEARNLLAAHGTTGLRVWDASLHLAYLLSTTGASLVEKKNILELGAGTGLLSILCAGPLKAHQVIATDGDAEVVRNIESNAALNSALLNKGAKAKNLAAKVLNWSDTSALPQILQHEGNELSLDVVLGADITYALEALETLVNMLSALNRKCPKVDIIISTVIRNEDTFTAFVNTCARAGFCVSSALFDCPSLDRQRGFFHKITPPIRILRLAQNLAASPPQADQTLGGIMNYIS